MRPKKPRVTIEGDNAQQIMARLGWMIGFDQKHVIWVFGILPGNPGSQGLGCECSQADLGDRRIRRDHRQDGSRARIRADRVVPGNPGGLKHYFQFAKMRKFTFNT